MTDPPWQKVVAPPGVITAVGPGFTVTVADSVSAHPLALVTVTVYAPPVATVTAAVVAAVDHR